MTTPLLKKSLSSFIAFLLFASAVNAQKNIAGEVAGADGNPLADVSVQVKETSKLNAASRVANYSIIELGIDSLVFTSVGYTRQLL